METIRIKLGPSFDYFYVGLIMVIGGLYFGLSGFPIVLIFIPLGVWVFLTPKGIEFDVTNLRRRSYYNFFFIKIGGWYPFPADDELWLTKGSQFQKALGTNNWARYGSSGYAYTFHITLASTLGDIELKVFDDYLEAKSFLEEYAALLQLKGVNDFENKIEEARNSNRRR